jgi:hypothetical protein
MRVCLRVCERTVCVCVAVAVMLLMTAPGPNGSHC